MSNENVTIRVIKDPDPSLITYRHRGFYDHIADILAEGSKVFIQNMSRRQASYARKVLSNKLKTNEIIVMPAIYEGQEGYILYVKKSDLKQEQ